MDLKSELVSVPNAWEPNEEEERDFWAGEGNLVFTVTANQPRTKGLYWDDGVFEVDIEEYSGCLGGFNEGIGIEWGLKEGYLNVDPSELQEGYTYFLDEVTVSFTRGDGWTTDDDSDYYVGGFRCERLPLIPYLKLKLRNVWWFNIGYKIREWRNS